MRVRQPRFIGLVVQFERGRISGLTINNRAFKPQLLNVRVLLSCIFQLALYFRTSTLALYFRTSSSFFFVLH